MLCDGGWGGGQRSGYYSKECLMREVGEDVVWGSVVAFEMDTKRMAAVPFT